LAYKFQTPGNYPEESIQRSQHDESLKSRILLTSQPHRSYPTAHPRIIEQIILSFDLQGAEETFMKHSFCT
jgi:hypothetical protein